MDPNSLYFAYKRKNFFKRNGLTLVLTLPYLETATKELKGHGNEADFLFFFLAEIGSS